MAYGNLERLHEFGRFMGIDGACCDCQSASTAIWRCSASTSSGRLQVEFQLARFAFFNA